MYVDPSNAVGQTPAPKWEDVFACAALQTHAQMDMRLEDEGIFEKPGQGPPLGPNDPRRLAVRAGCYVTPELMSMFEKISGGKRC